MAKHKGFYKEAGFDVNIKEYRYGMNVINEVNKKNATFGIGRASILINRSLGEKLVILASIFQSSPNVLITTNPNIKTIKDFKNKTVMVTGDAKEDATILSMIFSNALSINDLISKEHTFNIEDLINKNTDLMSSYVSNEPFLLDQQNIDYKIFDPKDYGFDFYNDILFTTEEFLHTNYDEVKAFREASIKGWEYAFNNIEESVNLILKEYNTQNKSKEALLYEAKELKKLAFYKTKKIGSIDKDKIEKMYNSYKLMGFMKKNIDFNRFVQTFEEKTIYLDKKQRAYLKEKKSIKFCIDPSWMPFEKIDKNGKHIGMTADYFELFKANIPIPFELVQTKSWIQTLDFMKEKKCDILSLAMQTPNRDKYMKFTTPYLKVPLVVATKLGVPFINDISELGFKKIAIPKGYAFTEIIKNRYPNIEVIEVENVDDGLEKLNHGEVYGYIGTIASITYKLQSDYSTDLKVSGKLKGSWDLSIAVRDDEPILLDIFEKAIDNITLEQNQKILNKWISIKYEQNIDYEKVYQLSIVFIIILIILTVSYLKQKKLNEKLELANKEIESRNKDLKKYAAMGEMIETITHQWKQPLASQNGIYMNMDIEFNENKLDSKSFEEYLLRLENLNQHMSNTVTVFGNYFKPNTQKVNVTLDEILEEFKKLKSKLFENDKINLRCIKDEDLENISLPYEFIQVLYILTNNSQDAFKDISLDNKKIEISVKKQGKHILFIIRDNAGGIKDDMINNIFKPHFTTKPKGVGTGIGLYIAKNIIENSCNGLIELKNKNDGVEVVIAI